MKKTIFIAIALTVIIIFIYFFTKLLLSGYFAGKIPSDPNVCENLKIDERCVCEKYQPPICHVEKINNISKKTVEPVSSTSKTEGSDTKLNGKILNIEKNEYINTPCVLSIESSRDIKVWFCEAEITSAKGLPMKSVDLNNGDNIAIDGKKIGCPNSGKIGTQDELCIKADRIIIN